MKIAVFGATLQAAVMSALSAEMGHFVSWCPASDLTHFELRQLNFDSELTHAIEMQLSQNFYRSLVKLFLKKTLTFTYLHLTLQILMMRSRLLRV